VDRPVRAGPADPLHVGAPRFVCAIPSEFFAAVRAELAERGEAASPQTRDTNPIYTGKDVSYIDTKQANRAAEDVVLGAERFAVFAALLSGASYPEAALAKAWVQLAWGAHHDAITGSESDQVYLDLLTGWRDAWELGRAARSAALEVLVGLTPTHRGAVSHVADNPVTDAMVSKSLSKCRTVRPASSAVAAIRRSGMDGPR